MTKTTKREDLVLSADDLGVSASTVILVKRIGDTLDRHYPGWLWSVEPGNGIVNIRSMLMHGKFGFTLHLTKVQEDPDLRRVVRAGGEMLERFGFRRGAYRPDDYQNHPRVAGLLVPDVTDLSKQEQRRAKAQRIRAEVASGRARITTDPRIGAALREANRA